MANETIKSEMKASGFHYWRIADALGISPPTLSVWLRHELPAERAEAVRTAIRQLKKEAAE